MTHHADPCESWSLSTRAVAVGRPHQPGEPLNVALTPATSFIAGAGPGYSRVGNPTWEPFEDVVGSLEGGRATAFASGMAAIGASFEVMFAAFGDGRPVVAAPHVHYSGSRLLLEDLRRAGRITLLTYRPEVDGPATVADADIVLIETPANPGMEITDIAAFAAGRARVICDNTYATPMSTRPLEYGADIVVHSASKYLAGHSDALIGVAVTADPEISDRLLGYRTTRGSTPGVMEAWLATRGTRTLPLRFGAASDNALRLARRLSDSSLVAEVRYPGLPTDPGHDVAARQMSSYGAMLTFRPHGGSRHAQAICEATRLWLHATSLGGVESTLERRRRHADESAAVPPDLIRLSVGCEDVEDLWQDLSDAITRTT